MVVATTATKRMTAEVMPAIVLGLETKERPVTSRTPCGAMGILTSGQQGAKQAGSWGSRWGSVQSRWRF